MAADSRCRFVCTLCQAEFNTEKRLAAHMADGVAHRSRPAWTPEDLALLDLSPNTMVASISEEHRELLCAYITHSTPQWPELIKIVDWVVTKYPTSLRLKEFVETVESFNHIGT